MDDFEIRVRETLNRLIEKYNITEEDFHAWIEYENEKKLNEENFMRQLKHKRKQ